MQRRSFSREFKVEAVRQVHDRGVPAAQVARDLGIHANVLTKWIREARGGAPQVFPGQGKPADPELVRIQRELKRVTAERDILKKAIAYFAKEPT